MLFNIIRCISLCKFALKLDEYLLLVHPNAHDGVDAYEEEGIGERGQIIVGDEALNEAEDVGLDAKGTEDDGEELTHHIQEQWVHAECQEESYGIRVFPFSIFSLVVDELHEDAQKPGGETASDEDVAWTPNALIDAETYQGEEET